ncbi:MAG: HlyD family efflux transporter periplasmic adaptor subunit [Candidatus Paceibacterota bacterium]|jgi:RND family efflux transporter MFP subunit
MTIFTYLRRHAFLSSALAIILVIIGIIAGRIANQKPETNVNSGTKKVVLASVADFRKDNLVISADGVVESQSQADLKSQMSAPISSINTSIGQQVYAGQVILELQNTDIRAQLSQAMASLSLATGQKNTGAASLESTKQLAIDKIRDAYIKCNDVINTQVDNILFNNDGNGGRLESHVLDNKIGSEITEIDIEMKSNLRDWKKTADELTISTDTEIIKKALSSSQIYLNKTDKLLGNIIQALNDVARYATPSFLVSVNSWKTIVVGARASVSGAVQALTGAEMSLSTASISQGSTAEAQISMAEAGVRNLEAQLAKTIIRSPINGKIAALPLRVGELASPGQLLVTVVGEGGLKVKAYASGEDLARIKNGAPVIIQEKTAGTVTSVAPSVSSLNRKVEVNIDVNDLGNSDLVIGQSVSVSITAVKIDNNSSKPSSYMLPIQNVKIVPGNAYVYTLDEESKIKRNEITLGQVQGDFVEVIKGLSDEMMIVTPVYELDEGESVIAQ